MYKLSTYNYFIPYQERMIYLNGLSMQVFSLALDEHAKLQQALEDMISFEINYTSVFKTVAIHISSTISVLISVSRHHSKRGFPQNGRIFLLGILLLPPRRGIKPIFFITQ